MKNYKVKFNGFWNIWIGKAKNALDAANIASKKLNISTDCIILIEEK